MPVHIREDDRASPLTRSVLRRCGRTTGAGKSDGHHGEEDRSRGGLREIDQTGTRLAAMSEHTRALRRLTHAALMTCRAQTRRVGMAACRQRVALDYARSLGRAPSPGSVGTIRKPALSMGRQSSALEPGL